MAKGKGSRNRVKQFPENVAPLVPERYFGRQTTRTEASDDLKRTMLDEAEFLRGVGDPLGVELEALTKRLPFSSFCRMVR
jgi:hypothetical protein